MRSRVVSKGEMLAKYGVEVRDFRYAFILPRSGTVRNDRNASTGGDEGLSQPAHTALAGKSPRYIEVKLRPEF